MPIFTEYLTDPTPLSSIQRMLLLKTFRQTLYGGWEAQYQPQALLFLEQNNQLYKRRYKGFRYKEVEISDTDPCPAYAPLHTLLVPQFLPLYTNMEQDYMAEMRQVIPYLIRLMTCCTWEEELYLAIPSELHSAVSQVVTALPRLTEKYLEPVAGEQNTFTQALLRVQAAHTHIQPLIKQRMVLNVLFNQT